MATYPRTSIKQFSLANPLYANATITAYTIDSNGAKTSTLASLYRDTTGSILLQNPQTLDSHGKWKTPVYADAPIIITITETSDVPDHDTGIIAYPGKFRGNFTTGTLYYAGDLAQNNADKKVYVAAKSFSGAAAIASDIAAERLSLVLSPETITVAEANNSFVTATGSTQSRTLADRFAEFANVKDFGVKGDGVTDDTAAIQANLNARKFLYFPPGRYIVSATLYALTDRQLLGSGAEITLFQRTANYGDTVSFGTSNPGESAANGLVKGIWYYKPQTGTPTATSIDHPVQPQSRHIRVLNGTRFRIEDCWFSGMPYAFSFKGSSLSGSSRCNFNGVWDPQNLALQESIASIYLEGGPEPGNYNVLMSFDDNNIAGGYPSAARNVVIGTATLNFSESIGPLYGILADSSEGLSITKNYFGGQSLFGIQLDKKSIFGQVRIEGNFFDPAINTCIYTRTTTTDAIQGLAISGNNFSGQNAGLRAILLDYSGGVSVVNANISGNTFDNFCMCPVNIIGAKGVIINGNNIAAYHYANGGNGNPSHSAGVYVGPLSSDVRTMNNMYGGGTNNLSTTNNCQWGVYFQDPSSGFSNSETEVSLGLAGGQLVYPYQNGDILSSNIPLASAVSLVTNVAKTITSIALTKGRWKVKGNIFFSAASGTVPSLIISSISTSPNTLPTRPGGGAIQQIVADFIASQENGLYAGEVVIDVPVTGQVVYLVGQANFTTSTMTGYGFMSAELIR